MAKKKVRVQIVLEHKTNDGCFRYHTTKNRRNTIHKLELKKYSPITKQHEIFKEIK